ncbi:MAG TPA: hypothetical protein EYM99_09345 [Alphaproteobacteria bacterium]|nr:hypothetical protein [Chromatiaceae bacterium]HIN93010.1 hypothetical protein [Alphaproteobacteria bacterium]
MKSETFTDVLYSAVSRLLIPLVHLLIRNGVSFSVFSELARRSYVKVAERDFRIPGKPQTNTRIATVTGLSRKEVLRIIKEQDSGEANLQGKHNRATRVISGWIREGEFHDKRGKPSALPLDGPNRSFSSLVKRFSGDIPARTILDELIHSGAVKSLKDGRIQLVSKAYIPATDSLEKVRMLGTDVFDLISSIDHNLTSSPDDAHFQRKVYYDNIPVELLDDLKKTMAKISQSALEDMNGEMAKCDRDSNSKIKGSGKMRAGISIFYFEQDLIAKDTEDE